MTRTEAERILRKELRRLVPLLGLDRWSIDLIVGRCSDSSHIGECSVLPEYERVEISVDPQRHDGPEDMCATLRHELFHAVLAPFDEFAEIVETMTEDRRTVRALYSKCVERGVLALERSALGRREPS